MRARTLSLIPGGGGGHFSGGEGSEYCYGFDEISSIAEDVMGYGNTFTLNDATPWVYAMIWLRQKPAESHLWRAVKGDPGAGSWLTT